MDRSAYDHIVAKMEGLLENRVFNPSKISREQIRVAHCLANYDRSGDSAACWLNQSLPPPFMAKLVANECNPMILE